mmetsp:Transcript_5431/g.12374  ORF Transcript_5431/g.12374 Transcript_5431/m.12374 type:complete len:219 (+) Transcript_5431:594-1250(+)
MPRVMNPDCIPRLTVSRNRFKCPHDIPVSWLLVHFIIHQNRHVCFLKPKASLQIFGNVQHIIVTSRKLPVLSYIINANQNRPLRPRGLVNNRHSLVYINHSRTGQLWYLRVSLPSKITSHSAEHLHPALVATVLRLTAVVIVEDLKQRGSAGASCTTSRIGQFEAGNVGISGGLGVMTTGYHADLGGDLGIDAILIGWHCRCDYLLRLALRRRCELLA